MQVRVPDYFDEFSCLAGAFWKGVDPCSEAGEHSGKLVVGNAGEKRRRMKYRKKFFHKKPSFVENSTDLLLLV